MRYLIPLVAIALLSSCTNTKYVFPDPPPPMESLPKDVEKTCDKLEPLTDKSIITLTKSDLALVYAFARCKNRGNTAVELYKKNKEALDKYLANYEKAKKVAKK